ncbi:uncharacterized protein [Aristolochia californica]|uniref:uncharacterized protein isoform X3 n=1 Tax=Aristolochia californica TaxID=171875 RepID=UPI0035DC3C00
MANSSPRYAAPSPLSIPAPRSPPKYPDLCGRHRKQAELQVLNREIGFLETGRSTSHSNFGFDGCFPRALSLIPVKWMLLGYSDGYQDGIQCHF